jgi:hypothetical protein
MILLAWIVLKRAGRVPFGSPCGRFTLADLPMAVVYCVL